MPTPVVAPVTEMPPEGDFRPGNRPAVRVEDATIQRDHVARLLEGDLRRGSPELSLNRLGLRLQAVPGRLLLRRCRRLSVGLSLHDQAAPNGNGHGDKAQE